MNTVGKNFFLHVKALGCVFRSILCRLLETAIIKNEIYLFDDVLGFKQVKNMLYLKDWNVYNEKPFAGPARVIEYLGSYTHRVAISNHRIMADENGKITFRYKDYNTGILNKRITLCADEFILRVMRHVLSCGFYRIRYFGILTLCNAQTKTASCFELLQEDVFLPALEGRITINTNNQIVFIPLQNILNIKAGRSYSIVICKSGESHLHTKPMCTLEEDLPEDYFIKCHRSYIINTEEVRLVDRDRAKKEILLSDNTKVPLSRRRYSYVVDFFIRLNTVWIIKHTIRIISPYVRKINHTVRKFGVIHIENIIKFQK